MHQDMANLTMGNMANQAANRQAYTSVIRIDKLSLLTAYQQLSGNDQAAYKRVIHHDMLDIMPADEGHTANDMHPYYSQVYLIAIC